jgi:hypothetical protein
MDGTCIICVMCEAIADDWVCWGSASVEEVFYFCTNDCARRRGCEWRPRARCRAMTSGNGRCNEFQSVAQ